MRAKSESLAVEPGDAVDRPPRIRVSGPLATDTSIDEFFDEHLGRVLGAPPAGAPAGSWYPEMPPDADPGGTVQVPLGENRALAVKRVHQGPSPLKILAAVDGSERSQRVVRYVGSVLADHPDAWVTLFHVLRPLPRELLEHGGSDNPIRGAQLSIQLRLEQDAGYSQEREAQRGILASARNRLTQAGIPSDRILLKFGYEEDIARNIREEAQAGGYGTVVVGRSGPSRTSRFFGGGITDHLLSQGTGRVFGLWGEWKRPMAVGL